MYDKSRLVLRVETVINNPEEFLVRKQVLRRGKSTTEWVAMRKGVAYLFRYWEVSSQANGRYVRRFNRGSMRKWAVSMCDSKVPGSAVSFAAATRMA